MILNLNRLFKQSTQNVEFERLDKKKIQLYLVYGGHINIQRDGKSYILQIIINELD